MSWFRPPHPHRGDSQGQANLYSCMYIHIYSIHSIYIYIHFYALELLIQPSLDSYLHKQTIYFTFYTASSIYLSIYTHTHIYIYIYIYISDMFKMLPKTSFTLSFDIFIFLTFLREEVNC